MSTETPWYGTKAWQERREGQLRREPLCRMCARLGITREAVVADHVEPHHGDRHAFFRGKLQSLCEEHHNRAKQADERRGFSTEIGPDGYPIDHNHPCNRGDRR